MKVGCPYRHVKLSDEAIACSDFAEGHCPRGASCNMRHTFPSSSNSYKSPRNYSSFPSSTQKESPTSKKMKYESNEKCDVSTSISLDNKTTNSNCKEVDFALLSTDTASADLNSGEKEDFIPFSHARNCSLSALRHGSTP